MARRRGVRVAVILLAAAPVAAPALAQSAAPAVRLDSVEMFALAEKARDGGQPALAEKLLAALTGNVDPQVRNEARFRLGQLLTTQGRWRDAAVQFRRVLDEQPEAHPARIELAGVLARLGDESGARRQLRAASAGRLPPEVARMVDRFANALRDRRPVGGSLQVALAPDSNINRSTRSDTLGTIIGDFLLTDEAKARSGVGAMVDAQQFARLRSDDTTSFLLVATQSARLYRQKQFNDVSFGFRAGPEVALGADRLNLSASVARRWFGHDPLANSIGLSGAYIHPVKSTLQLRANASATQTNNLRNDMEDATAIAASVGADLAISPVAGGGVTLGATRSSARDAGYSTLGGQASAYGFRDWGRTSLWASATVGRLAADERLFLYPAERRDWLVRGSIGLSWRKLSVHGFSPLVTATIERNHSNIEVYDFARRSVEFGIVRAF